MNYDFIVIGAGMAGASAAYELAEHSKVLLIEAESQPGYHSSGRSAALFTRNYGSALVRRVNALSEPFFRDPPKSFINSPLLQPRGALTVAGPGDEARLDEILALSTAENPVVELDPAEALSKVVFLRPERVTRAVFEPGVTDIHVAALLQSYLGGFRRRGGTLVTGQAVKALMYAENIWTVSTRDSAYRAPTTINAAGAWADDIGLLAGASPIGLVAKRRTAIIVEPTLGVNVAKLPCIDFAGTDAYIKPDGGKLMVSPGDATPVQPQDVQPDELDVAVLADWIERETLIPVQRILHRWAGLRSFVSDDGPVVGLDCVVPGFFWHAGQGGYGIMMAPALARAVANLCLEGSMPADFSDSGITAVDLGPARLSNRLAHDG